VKLKVPDGVAGGRRLRLVHTHTHRNGSLSATVGTTKTLQVKVKPNAGVSSLEEKRIGSFWQAQLKSPPVDGKANEELVTLIAKQFGCRKSAVSIKSGASRRMKFVRIAGL